MTGDAGPTEVSPAGACSSDDLERARAQELRERFERLRSLPMEEALSSLEAEAQELESRLRAFEEGSAGLRGPNAIEGVFELGSSVRALFSLVDALSPQISRDPLEFIDDELDWIERSARELGRWSTTLADPGRKLLERVAGARRQLAALRQDRLMHNGLAVPGPDGWDGILAEWARLQESFDVEVRLRGIGGIGDNLEARLAALEEHRGAILCSLRADVLDLDAEDKRRFAGMASADLLDRAHAAIAEAVPAASARRLPALRVLRERIRVLLDILGPLLKELESAPGVGRSELDLVRKRCRELRAARRRARTLEQEGEARQRIEQSLCGRLLARLETPLVFLIFLFVGVVALEWQLPSESPWLAYVHAADIALCLVFQAEFLARWAVARWRWAYFWRHFFLESLPAVPYGFLLHHLESFPSWAGWEELRAIVIVRLLGFRGVLLVLARAARIAAFFVRGTDRVVERYRTALDRDVLLFDDPPASDSSEPQLERRLLAVESRRRKCTRKLFEVAEWDHRSPILSSCLSSLEIEARLHASAGLPYLSRPAASCVDVHIERVIHGLLDCDSSRVIALFGRDGAARIARWLRFFDVPIIRHGPVVRRLVPAARTPSPPEAVAAAAHALGQMLQKLLGVLRFWGDLSGITTGPQILDRVGTAIVTATSRPAVRLLVLAIVILSFKGFAFLVPALDRTAQGLWRGLGTPVLVLGVICLVLMFVGRWLKRIAGEALDLYLRTADAHFYPLLKSWKLARRDRDLRTLTHSVFAAESRLRGVPLEAWVRSLDERANVEAALVSNLYQDFLDGPLLHRSDDKTSVQLLGNLCVQDVRFQVLGVTRREVRALERLDLEKQRMLGLGPYFWFRFITESLAIETAKLVMEYNSTCIPLCELPFAPQTKRERLAAFLASRKLPWDVAVERSSSKGLQLLGEAMTTDAFTALHFLSADRRLEDAVRARFGEEVVQAMRRDRVGMVRDIFGTRPYHLLPRSGRAFNPYRLYRRYLSGALFLFFPLTLFLGAARLVGSALRDILRLTLDLLGRGAPATGQPCRAAGFDVAVRKIHRMRKPFFMEALRLRAALDVEYLGLRVPGCERDEGAPFFRDDLDFIGALESERRPLEALRDDAQRDLRALREHLDERGWLAEGLEDLLKSLDPSGELLKRRGEAVRALVTAFITDHNSLRSTLTAPAMAREAVQKALERKSGLRRRLWLAALACSSWILPSLRRRRRLLDEYIEAAKYPRDFPEAERARLLREILASPRRIEKTLELAARVLRGESGSKGLVESELRRALLDHPAWTRRILILRALQSITVLDIQCYSDLVREAGEYGKDC